MGAQSRRGTGGPQEQFDYVISFLGLSTEPQLYMGFRILYPTRDIRISASDSHIAFFRPFSGTV